MREYMIFLFIMLADASVSYAQVKSENQRFHDVDAHVSQVNKQAVFHPQLLAKLLSDNFSNDYDKVRAFYVWIAKNIDYDLWAFIHDRKDGQGINEVLRSGKALCSGYSLLFDYFCEQANIQSEIIEGYAKGLGYEKKQKFNTSNHAWNAVNIYGKWYLLDVTWAAGNPQYLSKHEKKIDLDTWFLADPEKFVKTHLPEDPSWQLLDNKISLSVFEDEDNSTIHNWNFNAFSPEDYAGLDEYDRDILVYKRAFKFNPKNVMLAERLSFAYIYKGISTTDELWKMDYTSLSETADSLERYVNAYMDSAWQIIEPIDNAKISPTKNNILEEIIYQKGVINYELGVELFLKAMQATLPLAEFNHQTEKYFISAEGHFEGVPTTSIYYKDAYEYVRQIQDFRHRKTDRFIRD